MRRGFSVMPGPQAPYQLQLTPPEYRRRLKSFLGYLLYVYPFHRS
jgi:hypothetical protein